MTNNYYIFLSKNKTQNSFSNLKRNVQSETINMALEIFLLKI